MKVWIEAARLRTLPLAFGSILLGSLLAGGQGHFDGLVLALALATTVALQVLSNYANDLGDSLHGADHAGRKGPLRAVQAGKVSAAQMQLATIVVALAALGLGIMLLLTAFESWVQIGGFFGLGLLCVLGAVLYTNGKRPYGYMGLGDISVFIFFGLVGVIGGYFLYGSVPIGPVLLPAVSAGLLAVGVLNLNNLRDIESDKAAGKYSVPVRLGFVGGKRYHVLLITGAIVANLVFSLLQPGHSPYFFLWVIPGLALAAHARTISRLGSSVEADPYLKQLALLALATDVLLGAGYWLGRVLAI